jgi:hypothetical protein
MKVSCNIVGIALMMLIPFIPTVSLAQDDAFIVIHDKASVDEILPNLTEGAGKAALETKDVYKEDDDGKAAILVEGLGGDGQKFRTIYPGWAIEIKKSPKAGEYRYITFAWKKKGGAGIQLQLHATTNDWGHRYHAGVNEKNWNPSIEVNPKLPADWEIYTRDLATDWGEMRIDGIAFTAWSLDYGIWDHVVFHRTEEDPLAFQAVEPQDKLPLTWGKLKQASSGLR